MTFVFFLSGAAGLIFELAWFHRSALVFGNSVWAATVVLSSFMGGLAIGNALAGRYAPGGRDLLRLYAALEGTVAVTGLALTYGLPPLAAVIARLSAGAGGLSVNAVRLAIAFIVMIVPATAMGATLPIVTGSLVRSRGQFGPTIGRLYGWNTIGAVVGVVSAETLLVGRVGVAGAAWVAALLDAIAAALALRFAARDQRPGNAAPDAEGVGSLRAALPVLLAALLAGAALLSLEVVWLRFLSMYVLTTTLAMSLMLAVVLAAIGIGGVAGAHWLARGVGPGSRPATIALLAGCATVASYWAFQWTTAGAQIAEWWRVLWLAAALTAPTACLSGVLFTLLAAELSRFIASPTRASAWLTLANTTGAMCGPPIAALVLLPAFGMERAIFAVAAGYAVIGVIAAAVSGSRGRARAKTLYAAAAAALALVVFPFGVMERAYFLRAASPYAADGSQIVATRESPSETIFLMQQQWLGRTVYNRLVTNGFSMTGTGTAGTRYMRYFAYWPMLLHEGPLSRALVICYGIGVTAGAVLDIPSLHSLDVVEISPAIVGASDIVYAGGSHPLHDDRVRLHLEDGRFFLQGTRDRFDLITGEPPPPRTPGAVNIYSEEYFRLIYDRLADGGITTYWLPVARPDPGTDVGTIVRAFCDVFADCSLWNATPSDFMLVGTRGARGPVRAETFAAAWQDPARAARLREAGFEQPEQIGATFLGGAEYLAELTRVTPPLTDDFPHRVVPSRTRPSLSDPRYQDDARVMALYETVLDPDRARRAFAASPFVAGLWPAALHARTLPFFAYQEILNRVLRQGPRPLAQIEDLHALLANTTLRTLPLWLLGSDAVKQRIAESTSERTSATEYILGLGALSARDYLGAAAHLGEAERRGLHEPAIRALQVYAMCLAGEVATAKQLAAGVSANGDDEQHFWDWIARTFEVDRR